MVNGEWDFPHKRINLHYIYIFYISGRFGELLLHSRGKDLLLQKSI